MSTSDGVAVLLLLVLACVVDAAKKKKEHVVVLTENNFDEVLKANALVFVEFYAPWCGHCKQLAPDYEKAAKALSGNPVVVAKVDATEETTLATRYGVKGYPTLKLFREGVPVDYSGDRTAEAITTYLTNQLKPPFVTLSSYEEVEKFIPDEGAEANPAVVAYTTDGSPLAELFKALSKEQRDDFSFALVTDAELAKAKDEEMESLVLYKPFDDLKNVYGGPLTKDEVLAFLQANALPTVGEITPKNYPKYRARGLPHAWMFLGADKKVSDEALSAFRKAGQGLQAKLSMVYLSGSQYKDFAKKMALSGETFPAMVIEDGEAAHFVFDEATPLTEEAIRSFLTRFLEGKLEAKMRSQEAPAQPYDEDGVRVVVGSTFTEVVMDPAKDVLIEFYAPWCQHCKALTPIYGKLATQLKDVSTVVIAKTDATENDYPSAFKINGFPTIKLVQAGSNKVVDFSGERTLDALLAFLKENCIHPLPAAAVGKVDDEDEDDDEKEDKDEL